MIQDGVPNPHSIYGLDNTNRRSHSITCLDNTRWCPYSIYCLNNTRRRPHSIIVKMIQDGVPTVFIV